MDKLYHVVTDNIKTNKYQLNEAIYNDLTFDTNIFNSSSGTRDPLPVVTVTLGGGKKHRVTTADGLTFLWDSRAINSTIKRKHIEYYERKMRSNKVDYCIAAGMYCTTHDIKVTFCMPLLFTIKMINHRFHVNNDKVELGIGYEMIIGHDLMTQLGLNSYFNLQALQWYGATVYMKEPICLLDKSNLNKRKIQEVVMQAAEPAYTIEATERMVKILDSTYVKAYLKQVANNATQMNYEERNLLLILLEYS